MPGEAERAAHQSLRRRRAKQDERLRRHRAELLLEPRAAGVDLEALRGLVDPSPAALLELEVLDDVGHVGLVARDGGGVEAPVELPARRAHERLSGEVLLVARLLAHEHDAGALQPLAEDGLRRTPPEVAAAAAGGGRAEFREGALLGQERRGVVRLGLLVDQRLLSHPHPPTRCRTAVPSRA
jgi:hypothetical protein